MARSFVKILALVSFAATATAIAAAQTPAPMAGDKVFSTYCAGCHGSDGKGGDKAPSIATMPDVVAMQDSELIRIVTSGSNGGMPPFNFIGETNVRNVVRYLRTLQGVTPAADAGPGDAGAAPAATRAARGNGGARGNAGANAGATSATAVAITGNADNGKSLFFGKAQCSNCHMISGDGGVLGVDMTGYAATRQPAAILQSILHPGAPVAGGGRGGGGGGFGGGAAPAHAVEIRTKSGQTLVGLVRSENNLNIQLQTQDGRFHFLDRSNVTAETPIASLMPTDYGTRLTPAELNDIVSFLVVTSKSAPVEAAPAAAARRRPGGF